MTKFFRIFLRSITVLLLVLTVLVVAGYFALRSPKVQTYLVQKIAAVFSDELNADMRVGAVDFSFFNKLVLKDVYISDQRKDSLLFASDLLLDIRDISFFKWTFDLQYLQWKDVNINISRRLNEQDYNYAFLLKAFQSDEESTGDVNLTIEKLQIENLKLVLKDDHSSNYVYFRLPSADILFKTFDLPGKIIQAERIELKQPDFKYIIPGLDATLADFEEIPNPLAENDTTTSDGWNFAVDRFLLSEGGFEFHDSNYQKVPEGIDYRHITANKINMDIGEFQLIRDTARANVEHVSLSEHSGFLLDQLKGFLQISPSELVLNDFLIKTPRSTVKESISFRYKKWSDFSDFMNEVKVEASLKNSEVMLSDINFFAPVFEFDERVKVSGNFAGKVSNFKARHLVLETERGSYYKGNFDLNGLPDIKNAFADGKINDLKITSSDIRYLNTYYQVPEEVFRLGTIRSKGRFTGFMEDFVYEGYIFTALGTAHSDLNLKFLQENNFYSGNLQLDKFQLGKLLDQEDLLGELSLQARLTASGDLANNLTARLDANIDLIEFKGYKYNNVSVAGNVENKLFNGFMNIRDENIDLKFEGKVDFNKKDPEFNFICVFDVLKLHELKIVDYPLTLSGAANIDFAGNTPDDIFGTVNIDNLTIIGKNDRSYISSIEIASSVENGYRYVRLNSDVLDADAEGHFSWVDIVPSFKALGRKYFPELVKEGQSVTGSSEIAFNLDFKNEESFWSTVLQGAKIKEGASLDGFYNIHTDSLFVKLDIPEATYQDVIFKDVHFLTEPRKDFQFLKLETGKIIFADSLYIKDVFFHTDIYKDSVIADLNISRSDRSNSLAMQFTSTVKDSIVYFSNNAFSLLLNEMEWKASEGEFMRSDLKNLYFNNFRIFSGDHSLAVNGTLSKDKRRTVRIDLNNVLLEDLLAIRSSTEDIMKGSMNGRVVVRNALERPWIDAKLDIKDYWLYDRRLGDIFFESKSRFNKTDEMSFSFLLNKSGNDIISLAGEYIRGRLYGEVNIDRFDVTGIEGMVKDYVTNVSGNISAKNVKLRGTLKDPYLIGELELKQVRFVINYLGTYYELQNPVKLEKSRLLLKNNYLVSLDSKTSGTLPVASISGELEHEFFRNFFADIEVRPQDNFKVLGTTSKDNEYFYGNFYVQAPAYFSMYGPIQSVMMNFNATTAKGTQLNFPITEEETDLGSSSFITFISRKDTLPRGERKTEDGITFNSKLAITRDADFRILLGGVGNDILEGTGTGNLIIDFSPGGDLNMYGRYTLEDGKYNYSFENLIKKHFELERGGYVTWNGNPYDARINVKAIYETFAKPDNLFLLNEGLQDKNVRRIKAEVHLLMTGALSNPDYEFTIHTPENKEIEQQYLATVTSDEKELYKQVFNLLVLNNFAPPANQRSAARSNLGAELAFNTISDLLSNQLNNWFENLGGAFFEDLSITKMDYYEAKDFSDPTSGQDLNNVIQKELQIGLSKKLFNKRVELEVGGNIYFGDVNNDDRNLAGDFSIIYLITPDGRITGKVFNRNVNSTLTPIQGYLNRTGAGIAFRKKYDHLSELFRKKEKEKQQEKEKEEDQQNQ